MALWYIILILISFPCTMFSYVSFAQTWIDLIAIKNIPDKEQESKTLKRKLRRTLLFEHIALAILAVSCVLLFKTLK